MRLVCAPQDFPFVEDGALNVILYGQPGIPEDGQSARGSAGQAAKADFLRKRFEAAPRAWDFLSIALSVVTADLAVRRADSPDGWTREIDLTIAVADAPFWRTQASTIESALKFLSTDRWRISFVDGGMQPAPPRDPARPDEDCVVLLSGGLDSLIGAIDLTTSGKRPLAVSHVVRGDGQNQESFAAAIGGGLQHLALNHNANPPGSTEDSQRARSLIFLAFGILAATSLAAYHDGGQVPLYVCENGFIALNPPLTGARLGSLSTRTAHPEFLNRIREVLAAARLRVPITNPYEHRTKGEMLKACGNQQLLASLASQSVSCGRYRRYNYHHCGRCVPCHIRRSAFLAWGQTDGTSYKFDELGRDDGDHANFDDVRSVAMAIAEVKADGLEAWLGAALSYPKIGDAAAHKYLIKRGLAELSALHHLFGVK
ncbi:MAG: 7-cyano-7-deazaguanine synthase [Novosphingobium sp.]|jgi:7-cyano-7-deazaguanine synthase in queuosine biosynthesis|uniref:Qat anti-phage system QueC-like protein QatC n=1 Tax=Novosphingobium sp. TaxID=1874826 RepID=UPI0022BDFDC6|nr:Qat anti-phage system QueC-like protein QatC [Novosphingobium sp.]MCZ8035937.1 7-cyano-7-deazaguanine synthase [Novosphingobium sp.]